MSECTLIDLQESLFEMLIDFDNVCMRNGLNYSLAFGTLLGAIRHKGFIPWDDDVDIIMLRDDFRKLCKLPSEEFGEAYFFQTKDTDPLYPYNIARLRKNNSAMIYTQWVNAGFHQGIYIDIYPVDVIPNKWRKFFRQRLGILFYTIIRHTRNKVLFLKKMPGPQWFKKGILWFSKNINYSKLYAKEEKLITKYNSDNEANYVGIICEGKLLFNTPRDMRPFPRDYVNGFCSLEMNGKQFMSIVATHEILTHWYGDYMTPPPIEERVITHSPLYLSVDKSYKNFI